MSREIPRIAAFEKVSFERFKTDWEKDEKPVTVPVDKVYGDISLPVRATKGSAGYDFCSTEDITLAPGESVKILTGIRARMEAGWVLLIFPRSGLGFKYRLQLDNSTGVIDQDYYDAPNEGHIQIKITNDSKAGKTLEIKRGTAFAQGVFVPFGITGDDLSDGQRLGGLGSTGM